MLSSFSMLSHHREALLQTGDQYRKLEVVNEVRKEEPTAGGSWDSAEEEEGEEREDEKAEKKEDDPLQ